MTPAVAQTDASALRIPPGHAGGAAVSDDIVEIAFRQPCDRVRSTLAGVSPSGVAAEVVAVLDRPAATLTALADEPPQPNRCWIAAGPDGPRLARVGGIEAEPLNLALAALDAAGIADPKEPSLV